MNQIWQSLTLLVPDKAEPILGNDFCYFRTKSILNTNMYAVDSNNPQFYRVRSGVIFINDDGISGFLKSVLRLINQDPSKVKKDPENIILYLEINSIIDLGLRVMRNPTFPPDAVEFYELAHCLIQCPEEMSKSKFGKLKSKLAAKSYFLNKEDSIVKKHTAIKKQDFKTLT